MNELVWALMGFTFGSLIFSFFLRKEKIKAVMVSLVVIWGLTFFIEFMLYLSVVTPAPPEELNVLGGITLIIVSVLLISEFLKRKEKNNK